MSFLWPSHVTFSFSSKAYISSGTAALALVQKGRRGIGGSSTQSKGQYNRSSNIYILIALALDESIILDVPQFPMQNIYQSCDLGRAIGRRNVNANQ